MKIILKKLTSSLFIMLIISIIVFFSFQILPGNAVTLILGTDTNPQREQQLIEELGLNLPPIERYFIQMKGYLSGDLGNSIKFSQPVTEILRVRLPATLTLSVMSLILIILISLPVGILGGVYYKKFFGKFIIMVSNTFTAIPSYFLGVIITIIFGLTFKLFQNGTYVSFSENPAKNLSYLFFPSLAIALPNAALLIKFLASSINEQFLKSYVKTARSKGASEFRIVFKHVFKNSMLPSFTLFGLIASDIFCGSIVVEQIFNIPGIGRLLITAIFARDLPLLQSLTFFSAFIVVFMNFFIDIVITIVDPRIKLEAMNSKIYLKH